MSVLQPKNLYRGYIGVGSPSAASVLYTAPFLVPSYSIIKEIVLCNTDTVTVNVNVYTIEDGGTVADNRKILSDAPVAPGATVIFSTSSVLDALGTIRASASIADAVTATISGVEMDAL